MLRFRGLALALFSHAWTTLIVALAFSVPVLAQDAPAPGAAPPPPGWTSLVPIAAMVVFMYFFMMRPQAKKMKQRQEFINQLKRGDQVVTGSGILGRVEGITDEFVTLEIADGVRVKMVKSQVLGSANKTTANAREARA